ncbi:MGMT family protein [Mycetocola saprophilus]|uniref:MGMT family protein n=1 Tax=Mycetocola saprophilus TaxID=76636 RepID=UPI003BF1B5DC
MTAQAPISASGEPEFRVTLPRIDDPEAFLEAVYRVVLAIPSGRVMSYGGVAAAMGTRAARQVGAIMARQGQDLPWWRVLRADGTLPTHLIEAALEHGEAEGTALRRLGGHPRPTKSAFVTRVETVFEEHPAADAKPPGTKG